MNETFQGLKVMVVGNNGLLKEELVRNFIQQGITVVAPISNALEGHILKGKTDQPCSGQLITLLTDLCDYSRFQELGNDILEEFGQLQLVVYLSQNVRLSQYLFETSINEWEKMIEEDITALFIAGKLFLEGLKNSRCGMFLHITNHQNAVTRPYSSLANIAASAQQEIIKHFIEEGAAYNLRYQQLAIEDKGSFDIHNMKAANDTAGTSFFERTATQILDLFYAACKDTISFQKK